MLGSRSQKAVSKYRRYASFIWAKTDSGLVDRMVQPSQSNRLQIAEATHSGTFLYNMRPPLCSAGMPEHMTAARSNNPGSSQPRGTINVVSSRRYPINEWD